MIRKLLRKVFRKSTTGPSPSKKPVIFPFKEHGISRDHIAPCAKKAAVSLQQAGFKAFVVGGAVRDLLLGREPKDFDIATDARPEQVRSLFRRSRVIGRRFRLVHVMCGNEIVEVSTFRAGLPDGEEGDTHSDEHGRILRDNVFGTQDQDAERRDFTINALFYDPTSQEIWDYQHGFPDIKKRVLRMIGDPEMRYREDPIRMLRAVRLAAKLELKIDEATAMPITRLAPLLQNVPAARVFDEMLKFLLSGHSLEGVMQLRDQGLHHGLLPMLDVILEQPLGERFVMLALKNTDERIRDEKPVSPGFLFAALLWHEVLAAWKANEAEGMKRQPALYEAMEQVIDVQAEKLAIPRRYGTIMKEIWGLQPRLAVRSGSRPQRVLEHPRFRAGYDFLLLRCASGEVEPELGQWWEAFQSASPSERSRLLLPEQEKRKRRRSRPRKARPAAGEGAATELDASHGNQQGPNDRNDGP